MSIQKCQITVQYRPRKELLIADTLSRAPLPEPANELEFKQYDINVLHTLPITESKLKQIQDKTKEDKALQDLMVTVHNSWPPNKTVAPIGTKPFWNYYDEVSHHHGILFKGQKVIIATYLHAYRDATDYSRLTPWHRKM